MIANVANSEGERCRRRCGPRRGSARARRAAVPKATTNVRSKSSSSGVAGAVVLGGVAAGHAGDAVRERRRSHAADSCGYASARAKRSGSNGAGSITGDSPEMAWASSRPVIGPSATPAPSWPVASHVPGSCADGPIAGSRSGSQGQEADPRPVDLEPGEGGEEAGGAGAQLGAEARVDRRVEAAALARRADDDVPVPRRLGDAGDRALLAGVRHGEQVGRVDDLVADEALVRVG